jgi:predicted PurR-regulated permease PerM
LAGQRGVELVNLSESTIRSVARGVLGVAVIQAFMAGVGMVLVGVPFAGLWTVVALLLGVLQVGVALVVIPAVIYVFSTHDSLPATLFLIWSVIVIFTDNVLKPLLLGRGLDVPMLVIFVGALGGMIMSGIIGLFVGAILLALGYKVFLAWLDMEGTAAHEHSK